MGADRLTIDGEGHPWFWNRGLSRLTSEGVHQTVSHERLPSAHKLCMQFDRGGALWLGFANDGLVRYSDGLVRQFMPADGLSDNWINCVLEDRDGNLWIGTDGGVCQWRADHLAPILPLAGLRNGHILALHEDPDGTLWIGTGDSLEQWSANVLMSHRWSEAEGANQVRAITADRAGDLWVGRPCGLMLRKKGGWTQFTTRDGLPHDDVRALMGDSCSNLWIGTFGGGLCMLAPGTLHALHRWANESDPTAPKPPFNLQLSFTTTNGLPSDAVWALHEDATTPGVIWAGTERGLARLTPSFSAAPSGNPAELGDRPAQDGYTVFAFLRRDGLFEDAINEILEDDLGCLWLSSYRGLSRVEKRTLDAVAAGQAEQVNCVVYDEADGLLSAEFNGQRSQPAGCKTSDGRLWFPSTKGVVVVDPARVVATDRRPSVVVEQVLVDGESQNLAVGSSGSGEVQGNGELSLPPGRAQTLEIRYAAPSFRTPDRVRFRYRLHGFDRDWVEAGNRRVAVYAHLPPGGYRFEVLAARNHGLWSETSAAFAFVLAPRMYERWGFWPLCLLAIGALAAGTIRWRFRLAHTLAELRRESSLARERDRIARDMHDDLGDGLTRLTLLGQRTARHLADPTLRGQVERMNVEASTLVDNLGELVWATDARHDALESLLRFLREHAAGYLADAQLEAQLDFPASVPSVAVPGVLRRTVLLALKEALHNAVRHAQATEVTVTCRIASTQNGAPQALELAVADNGCGFESPSTTVERSHSGTPTGSPKPSEAENPLSHGTGLPGLRARLERVGGSLYVRSAPGQGTTLVLRVPLALQTDEGQSR